MSYKWCDKSQIISQILLCLPLISTAFADDVIADNIEKSFQVAPSGRLTIDSDRGSIEVRTTTRNVVDVLIKREVKSKYARSAEEILKDFVVTFEQNGRDVQITAKFERDQQLWDDNRNRLRVQFVITVPKKYNLDLRTGGGGISVADLEGEVRSQTSGGSLRFGEIKGPVWGRTSGDSIKLEGCEADVDVKTSGGSIAIGNVGGELKAHTSGGSLRFGEIKGPVWGRASGGSIKLKKCEGDVDIETSGGGIEVGNVDGQVTAKTSGGSIHIGRATGRVRARASGGGITVEEVMGQVIATTSGGSVKAYISRQPEGDCTLETSGASLTVSLASDVAFDVDAKTSCGHVSTDFPVVMVVRGTRSKNRLQGTINGGGPQLKLRTVGGNIRLRKIREE